MQPFGKLNLLPLEQREPGVLAESGPQSRQPGAEPGEGKWEGLDKPALLLRMAGCSAGLAAEGKVAATRRRGGREQLAAIALRGCTLLRGGRQENLQQVDKHLWVEKYFQEAPDRGGQPLLV